MPWERIETNASIFMLFDKQADTSAMGATVPDHFGRKSNMTMFRQALTRQEPEKATQRIPVLRKV